MCYYLRCIKCLKIKTVLHRCQHHKLKRTRTLYYTVSIKYSTGSSSCWPCIFLKWLYFWSGVVYNLARFCLSLSDVTLESLAVYKVHICTSGNTGKFVYKGNRVKVKVTTHKSRERQKCLFPQCKLRSSTTTVCVYHGVFDYYSHLCHITGSDCNLLVCPYYLLETQLMQYST